jgi:hypothetical protein
MCLWRPVPSDSGSRLRSQFIFLKKMFNDNVPSTRMAVEKGRGRFVWDLRKAAIGYFQSM